MTSKQYWIVGLVAALSTFIGVGIVLLITSGDDRQGSVQVGPTTSSQGSVTTTTVPPTTTSTVAPTTLPPITPGTITPGTTAVIPPSTSATTAATQPPTTTTTRAPVTTTRAPDTTTTTEPDRRTDVGISDDEIRLAVIADSPETFAGMEAWKTLVNRRGGIADRDVELDLLETGGTAEGYAAAVQDACAEDFAIVGSFSIFDGAADALGCDLIPDLPVEAVDAGHATASSTFAAFPRQPGIAAIGPYKWLLDNVSGCCAQYVLVPDTEPGHTRTLEIVDTTNGIGFTPAGTADVTASDDATRYTEIVDEIEAAAATFALSGLGADSTRQLREAAAGRAASVLAWFCDAQCYDESFISEGGAAIEGQYVAIETALFSDRADIPTLRSYLKLSARADVEPSYAGLRAFAAGLLFEQSAKAVVDEHGENGLTRVRLFDSLAAIHDFTAGGIVGATDVASGTPNGCYVLTQVVEGKFKRVDPTEKAALTCGSENLVELAG